MNRSQGIHLLDGGERIGPALPGRDQGGTDLGIEAELFGDGPAIPVKGVGVAAFGAPEQAAEKTVEDAEGQIAQGLAEVEGDGGEGGQTAQGGGLRQVLHRGPAALAGKLAKPVAMKALATLRGQVEGADVRQPLEYGEQGGHAGRRGSLEQPSEAGEPRIGAGFQQGFELLALAGGQAVDQRAVDLLARL